MVSMELGVNLVHIKDLKIGEKLEICLIDKENKNRSPYYSIKLQNIRENGTLEIDLPMFGTQLFSFKVNEMVQVSTTQEDGIYSFNGQIIGKDDKLQIPIMVVKPHTEMTKMQRRTFFRIKCNCNIKYRSLDQAVINQAVSGFKNAIIIDLSGGGMCILGDQKIEKNILLECVIMLENNQEVTTICKVINSKKDEREQSRNWKSSLMFHTISERSREKVINFVFQEQMKFRRKGLI